MQWLFIIASSISTDTHWRTAATPCKRKLSRFIFQNTMNKLTQSYGTVEKYVYTTMHPCTYTQHYFLVLFLQQRTTHREKKKKGAPLLLFWFWKIQTNIKKRTNKWHLGDALQEGIKFIIGHQPGRQPKNKLNSLQTIGNDWRKKAAWCCGGVGDI